MKSRILKFFQSLSSRSRKQKLLVLGVVFLILGAVWYSQSNTETQPTYQFSSVERGDITQFVSETGQVETNNKVVVNSTSDGVITEVYVQNGAFVKQGQQLFYVKSTASEAERSKAYADYQSAKATLEQSEASQYSLQSKMFSAWDDFKELAESDEYKDTGTVNRNLPEFHIPEKDWLAAEAEYKAQTEVLAKAKASLNAAWLTYLSMSSGPVKATSDGVVENMSFAVGQLITSTDPALIITTGGESWVKVAINENDISDVQPGQSAQVIIDALDGKQISATVQRVDTFGTDVSDVMVYYVYLTLSETPTGLKPGMTAQVDIVTRQEKDVLLVPNIAIKPYQGEKAVQQLDQSTNTVIYKPITAGVVGDTNTQVVSGLSAGEQIILSTTSQTQSGGGLFSRPR